MADPTGEANRGALRLDFDRRLLLQFCGSAITSDAGLLPYRELDDAVGLTDTAANTLADARTGKNIRHLLGGLLRQSVFGRLAGYEDVNDADRLCRDPAIRWVVGDRAITGSAASASQMGRFETEWLARPENLAALADLPGQWIDTVHRRRPPKSIVLDMDSSESPTYGVQESSAYNGHFGCTCYHPLFVFNQLGDLERCALRSGNVHSAAGWRDVLEPVVVRYRGTVKRRYFRGDAAFANPEIYEFLEAEGMGYAIRLPANRVLQDKIGYLLNQIRLHGENQELVDSVIDLSLKYGIVTPYTSFLITEDDIHSQEARDQAAQTATARIAAAPASGFIQYEQSTTTGPGQPPLRMVIKLWFKGRSYRQESIHARGKVVVVGGPSGTFVMMPGSSRML